MLSHSTVTRGLGLLERDQYGELHAVELVADIALARCPRCGMRPRVLPYDVLPRKHYSLAVIGELSASYSTWARSLRAVVWDLLGERSPSHATLHGWTEGLGGHALGLPGGEAGGAPFSRFAAEVQTRVAPAWAAFEAPRLVEPRRYRSEGRRERLSALASVLVLAQVLSGPSAAPSLGECRHLALRWLHSSVLVFPSRFSCTAIEQVVESDRRSSRSGQATKRASWPIRTRSPPGASSR